MSTQKSIENNDKDLRNQDILSDIEKDTIGEIGNICMGTCATTLSTLLGRRVTITTPTVDVCKSEDFLSEYEKPLVIAEISYTQGIEGKNIFVLKKTDAVLITDLLMGNDGSSSEEELSEYFLSATSEVMNQMVGSAATALADIMKTDINISPPQVNEYSKENSESINLDDEIFIKTSFRMEIEDLLVSNIMNLMSIDFGKKLTDVLIGGGDENKEEIVEQEQITEKRAAQEATGDNKDLPNTVDKTKVDLKAIKYQSFDNTDGYNKKQNFTGTQSNIDIIMEVPLQVTVVLGRSKKSIKEILELGAGSIVVLERYAGEMVDVLVNGKMFARGEVVVVDDNYGVRITEVIEADYLLGSNNKVEGKISRII